MLRQKSLLHPTASFARKTILITGANTGLGLEATSKFAALGAPRLILGCRDVDKGEAAKSLIKQRTGNKAIQVWPLDMNSYDSVHAFAKRAADLDRLDVAVLNAGVFKIDYEQSYYGWEETLQVNVLSTTLLAMQLLPKLRLSRQKDSHPVLELVSSRQAGKITFNEFQLLHAHLLKTFNDVAEFKPSQQYQLSKYFLFCIMDRLARIVRKYSRSPVEPDVIVTSVCPGFCHTDLNRGRTGIMESMLKGVMNSLVLRTAEEGARTLVSGVTQGLEAHGKLWYDDTLGQAPIQKSQIEEGFDISDKIFNEVLDSLDSDVPDLDEIVSKLKG